MDDCRVAHLAPFNMVLKKLMIRPEIITGDEVDFDVDLKTQVSESLTVTTVATATVTHTSGNPFVSHKNITLLEADFSAQPRVVAGQKCALSLDCNATPSGTIDWYITSVWEVEQTL